jgi:hypothetical protein
VAFFAVLAFGLLRVVFLALRALLFFALPREAVAARRVDFLAFFAFDFLALDFFAFDFFRFGHGSLRSNGKSSLCALIATGEHFDSFQRGSV